MKKTSKSRMKKLPILLGTLLIISVAAYGTRAYFSDSATVQGDIALELGTVDIETVYAQGWTPVAVAGTSVTAEVNNKLGKDESNQVFKNVRPGDAFTKVYTLNNKGTLDVKVNTSTYTTDFPSAGLQDGPFTITLQEVTANGTKALEKTYNLSQNDSKKFLATIKVDPDKVGDTYNKGNLNYKALNPDKTAVDYFSKQFSVTAVQTNAK